MIETCIIVIIFIILFPLFAFVVKRSQSSSKFPPQTSNRETPTNTNASDDNNVPPKSNNKKKKKKDDDEKETQIVNNYNNVKIQELKKEEYLPADRKYFEFILKGNIKGHGTAADNIYAWEFAIDNESATELNIFFLGTSTAPFFSTHDTEIDQTGHILCQLALQKAKQNQPTVIVKGIGTINMGLTYPLFLLQNTSAIPYDLNNIGTTITGNGADTRIAIVMNKFIIPHLKDMISRNRGEKIIINIAGHSRGGITSFLLADCIDQYLSKSLIYRSQKSNIRIRLCALDPVEGAMSMSSNNNNNYYNLLSNKPAVTVKIDQVGDITTQYLDMPFIVEKAMIIIADDERRSAFKPTIPKFNHNTKLTFKRIAGKHGTMTGNFGSDNGKKQFSYPTLINDIPLQNATFGIFDETMTYLCYFFFEDNRLPAFPRNTFRRIINTSIYPNTLKLLLQLLGEDIKPNTSQLEVIKRFERMMMMTTMENNNNNNNNDNNNNNNDNNNNIVIYDCFHREASNALNSKHFKVRYTTLKTEWRKDSNCGTYDIDRWDDQRYYYYDSKNLRPIGELVDNRYCLPDIFYNHYLDANYPSVTRNKDHLPILRRLCILRKIGMVGNKEEYKSEFERLDINPQFGRFMYFLVKDQRFEQFHQCYYDSIGKGLTLFCPLELCTEELITLRNLMIQLNFQNEEKLNLITLKIKLDLYISNLEVYIATKINCIKWQNNTMAIAMKNSLIAIRDQLKPNSSIHHINDLTKLLENTIMNYKSSKKPQFRYSKSKPGSVTCLVQTDDKLRDILHSSLY